MAIGYAKIISNYYIDDIFYEDWLKDVTDNYELLINEKSEFISLSDEGDRITITTVEGKEILADGKIHHAIFRNCYQNAITCSLKAVDNYYVEDYSMDELLSNEDVSELYDFLHRRFSKLAAQKKGIGFIFDERGYSEDYIRVDKNVWSR